MSRFLHRLILSAASLLMPLLASAQLLPVPAFTASITTGCSPIVVNFTDASVGTPTSWLWNLGNGTTSTLQNPSTSYITPGIYTVTLTATNALGSATTTSVGLITVNPSPVVQFAGSDTSAGCAPRTVSFSNLSVPGALGLATYAWDFGDGTTSTLAAPSHTYTSSGAYTVTLVVTNALGCTKVLTKTNYINLLPIPAADFGATGTGSCTAPFATTFSNLTTGAVSYQWNFGDGTTSTSTAPSHTYTAPGAYTVTLIATNAGGCKDTIVKPAFVSIGSLDAALTPTSATACAGTPVGFSNTSTPGPGISLWTWGDGTTSSFTTGTHNYSAPGTYNVKLLVTYSGCSDSAFGTVTVQPAAVAAASVVAPTACAAPHTTSFTNSSTGASGYLWSFGDGSTSTATTPSHTYSANGSYTVTLIAYNSSGCNDTLVMPGAVNINPPAGAVVASPSGGCAPAALSFTASTTGTVASYAWTFGDGTTGSGASPSHTYSTPGTYTATCTFTMAGTPACVFTASTTVNIGTIPTASLTASPTAVCVGQPVTFTSTTPGGTYTGLWWTFGDGGYSFASTLSYAYGAPGTYTATLNIDNNGCVDTQTVTISVANPLANFNVTLPSCTDRKTFSFTNTSVGATSIVWNFGDGTPTTTAPNPTHTYASFGAYTVTLTVTNSTTGCTSVKSLTVEVFDLDAQFSAPDTVVCRNEPVMFTAATNPNYASYSWNFGDGTTASVSNPAHPYTASGTYTVRLIVGDWYGCKDTMIRTAYIKVASPAVAFSATPTGGCPGLTVNFVDGSTPASGFPITGRTWQFGDGTSFSSTTATTTSHTYPAGGSYSVTLVVYDASGCADSLAIPAFISVVQPDAAFAATDTMLCLGQATMFMNGTTGSSPTYQWNFGDGTTSTATSPTHTYAAAGSYTVTLIATDAGGCKDTLVKPAYVQVVPNAVTFLMSDSFATCPPLNVSFTSTTPGVSTYLWTFGDGTSSALANPSHLYTTAGTFTVKLKVTNAAGCIDSAQKTITVLGPSGTLSYTPLSGCGPMVVTLSSTNLNTSSLTWDMNNGFTATTSVTTSPSTYSYTYTTPGIYIPVLILSNGAGCNVAVQGTDTLKVSSVLAGFIRTPTSGCGTATVAFTDTSYSPLSPLTSWAWSFGDGGTSAIQNPTHTYTTAGTYTATLIATNSFGCSDTMAHTITVTPKPNGVATTTGAVCVGGSASLLATGGMSYSWSPAASLSCTTCPNPTATPASTATYTVVTTDAIGCTDTDAVTVTILPQPTVSILAPASVCAGSPAVLAASGASTYAWTGTALSGTTGATVSATPASSGTYTVVGTSATGCLDTATVALTVLPAPVLTGGGIYNVCNGATITLTAGGATSYAWSGGGMSATGASITVTPLITTTYTVIGATGTCYDTATLTVNVTSTPAISAGPDQSMCPGGSVTLTGGGATTYVWSTIAGTPVSTGTSISVAPTATTTYVVEGTAPGGCVGLDTVTVSIAAPPTVSAGAPVAVCAGGATTLTASGASTYTWSGTGLSSTTGTSVTATPGGTTTYTVIGATGAPGCIDTAQVTVTVNPLPTVSVSGLPALCIGASGSLTASGASTYAWAPATTLTASGATATVTPTTTSVYTVTGTSALGCTGAPASVTVVVNPLPVITVTPPSPTICGGTSVVLTASGAASYSWSGSPLSAATGATVTASPSTTTTYTVTGTSAAGCQASATTTVGVILPPNVTVAAPAPVCVGNTALLTATGATTYSWSPSTGLSSTSGATVSATPLVTTTYTVIGTASGCSDTTTQTVTVNPLPTITAGSPVSTCPGVSTTLSAGGGVSYLWSPAASLSCSTCASPVASPAATTTYTVQGTSALGCTNIATVTVTKLPKPPVSAGPDAAVCSGLSTTLTATGAVSYVWSPATGLSCTMCTSPVASPTAVTSYVLTGADINGCTATDTVVVSVGLLPTISAGPDQTVCAGTPATLTATGGATYAWTPGTGLSSGTGATVSATPATTTTYTVTGVSSAGCVGTDAVTVTVLPLPLVSAGADQAYCVGGSTTITASGASTYVWSPAGSLSCTTCTTPTAAPLSTTTYTLTGTDAAGCSATDAVTVTVNPLPSVNAGPDADICAGASTTLTASGAATYLWTPGATLSCMACPSPDAAPTEPSTTYYVTGTDGNGCMAADSVVVRIVPRAPMTAVLGDSVCKGESTTLTATGGMSYVWWPATGLNSTTGPSVVAAPEQTTTYSVAIRQNSCYTDTARATVVVNPVPTVNAGPDQSTWSGGTVNLFVQSTDADDFRWTPADGLSCNDCPTPVAKPVRTSTYRVEAYNRWGCRAYDEVVITVTCDASQVFVPNTFTPNGDGQNDRFYPRGKGIGEVRRFRIYDRWGELVYDETNLHANDLVNGWDGTYKAQPLKPDVYVWVLDAACESGDPIQLKGDISLIR